MKVWDLQDTSAVYVAIKNPLLYAMLFLMLLRCDLKKIIKLGPKMLSVSSQQVFQSVLVL